MTATFAEHRIDVALLGRLLVLNDYFDFCSRIPLLTPASLRTAHDIGWRLRATLAQSPLSVVLSYALS